MCHEETVQSEDNSDMSEPCYNDSLSLHFMYITHAYDNILVDSWSERIFQYNFNSLCRRNTRLA